MVSWINPHATAPATAPAPKEQHGLLIKLGITQQLRIDEEAGNSVASATEGAEEEGRATEVCSSSAAPRLAPTPTLTPDPNPNPNPITRTAPKTAR